MCSEDQELGVTQKPATGVCVCVCVNVVITKVKNVYNPFLSGQNDMKLYIFFSCEQKSKSWYDVSWEGCLETFHGHEYTRAWARETLKGAGWVFTHTNYLWAPECSIESLSLSERHQCAFESYFKERKMYNILPFPDLKLQFCNHKWQF